MVVSNLERYATFSNAPNPQLPAISHLSLAEIVKAIEAGHPPPALGHIGIPKALDAVLAKAMSFNPEARYQSAADFKRDLLRLAEQSLADLLPGSVIDEAFVVERRLNTGQFGTVYKVRSRHNEQELALKLMHETDELGQEAELTKRFLQEADLLRALDHPNIVKVFQRGAWRRRFYLTVMGRGMRSVWGRPN